MFTANDYIMIVDTITDLQSRGFTSNFCLLGNRLFCIQTNSFFSSNQFDVLEIHSFDNEPLNKSQTIIYAIECITNRIKGLLLENLKPQEATGALTEKLRKFWY